MDAREVALLTLNACQRQGGWSEGTLKKQLAAAKLDSRDAALATRLCFGVLQNQLLLDFYLSKFSNIPLKRMEGKVLQALRLGAYQMLFMDKIPHSAAVNEAVAMAKRHHRAKAAGMVNAVLRNLSRGKDTLALPEDLSVRYSHPKWLAQRYEALLGREEAEQCMEVCNTPVPTTIQCNPLRTTEETLLEEFTQLGITYTPHTWLSGCYELKGSGSIEQLGAFSEGRFMVQDAAAKVAAMAAGCRKGMRVIDLCAAPGGKSFAAAIAMENEGEILSCDIHPHKMKLIEQGAERLGITCIKTLLADGREHHSELKESADVVICDVPCSGLGIIRKKPDIRYKDPKPLAGLPRVQSAILENGSTYVKRGGVLLYSTCTILPEENEQVIHAFLESHSDFVMEPFALPSPVGETNGCITLWPQRHNTDGFFICKLRKQ